MFRSALIKLTLWYVAIAMVLSLLFSVALYHFASVELREGLKHQFSEIVITDHDTDSKKTITNQVFNERSDRLLLDLVYFNLFVFVLTACGSYFLARRSLRPIEEAHQAQVRFTAQASHELRTPLAAMRADTESVLMLKNASDKELRDTLNGNLGDIKRIETLAEHLLDVARFRSKNTLSLTKFDFKKIVDDAITQSKRGLQKSPPLINVNTTSCMIVGDKVALQSVVASLLDNAVKYGDKSKPIEVSLSPKTKNVELRITDHGKGIEKEELPHLFEPFYRARNQNASKGYGLGLVLAKEVVEAHEGSIVIESEMGRGTTVIVKLPALKNTSAFIQ